MVTTRGINAYNTVGIESGVAGASPHDLIIMLYQASVASIANAKRQITENDIAGKGKSISRAISLIGSGLQASLDLEAGGEIGRNLFNLYDYMINRLLQANISNDLAILNEVEKLMMDLQGAWESIKPSAPASGFQPTANHSAMTYSRV